MSWIECKIIILVESSSNRFRLWDITQSIPRPSKDVVVEAQILLPSGWEKMYFNTVWGKGLDSEKSEGTWLKQKSIHLIEADLGRHRFAVRYRKEIQDK